MHKMRGLKSSCACAINHQDLCYPLFIHSVGEHRRPWSMRIRSVWSRPSLSPLSAHFAWWGSNHRTCYTLAGFRLTLSLPQAIIIVFCKQRRSRWDGSWWAVSSGSTLFDIQSFNFTYKLLSKRQFVLKESRRQMSSEIWHWKTP